MRIRVDPARRCATCCSTRARSTGFGWSCFTAVDGDVPRDRGRRGRRRRSPTSTSGSRSTPTTARTRSTHADGLRGRRVSAGSSTAATAATRTTTRRPPTTRSIDRPDVGARSRCSRRARCGPASSSKPTYALAAPRRGRRTGVLPAQRRDRRVRRCARRSSSAPASASCASRTTIDNQARDHRLRAHFPLPAPVTGSDAECAFTVVHRGLTAEGGAHEFGAADVPVAPLRRRVRRRRRPRARCTTGCSNTKSSTTARELALTLLRAVGYLSRTEPSLRPNPAGPPIPLRTARSCSAHSAREYAVLSTAATGARPTATARPTRSSCRSNAPACTHRTHRTRGPTAGSALRVDGAEVSAVTRVPGGLVVRVFRTATRRRARCTIEHEGTPARGDRRRPPRPPRRPVRRRAHPRPWQIATLQPRA